MSDLGPIGRLGHWTAGHFRVVLIGWIVVAVGLGVLAPGSRPPSRAPDGRRPGRSPRRRGR